MSKKVVDEFSGRVPRTMEELLTLPGVARKTANVVLGTAYGVASGIVVDTHMFRVATRRLRLSYEKTPEKVEQDLLKIVPRSRWIRFSYQVTLLKFAWLETPAAPNVPSSRFVTPQKKQNDLDVGCSRYKAGQFVDIALLNPPETDAQGNTRGFSISSAPEESMIMITTRLRDTAFKRVLRKMPLKSELRIEGPFGNLTLHKNVARPAVMLAGGIGVTPFRSMIVNATKEKLAHHIFLFYSNRSPAATAFLQEFQAIETQNPNFKLIATMTEVDKSSPWKGEVGMIDHKMLDRHLKASYSARPIYYIAGPPQMVRDLQGMLTETGVDSEDVITEEFSGY